MSHKYLGLAAVLLAGAMLAPQVSHATGPAPGKTPLLAADGGMSLVEQAHWRPRCRSWRHACAGRWGWGTWRYYRCLRLHAC